MQKQHQSPQKLCQTHQSVFHNCLPMLFTCPIEEQLKYQYHNYRLKKTSSSLGSKIKNIINHCAIYSTIFLQQFWKEIIPEVIRGKMNNHNSTLAQLRQKNIDFFQEYRKKKGLFFLIIWKENCSEEQVQVAYMYATNITADGFNIRYDELKQSAFITRSNIKNMSNIQRFNINFLKFDTFGQLRWFGTIPSNLIISKSGSNWLQLYKQELQKVIKDYDRIQNTFLGSYVQKQDRFQLESVSQK